MRGCLNRNPVATLSPNLRTGEIQSFTGGKEAADKAEALENELEAFESTSDPVCPKCGQVIKEVL